MINGFSTPSRREMYCKYNKSSIFSEPVSKENHQPNRPAQGRPVTAKIGSKKVPNKEFEPHFEVISAKERYQRQFRTTNQNKDNLKKKQTTQNTQPAKQKVEKPQPKKNLQAQDILCRDMLGGMDPKEYRLRRSKSTYLKSSTGRKIKEDSDARTRGIAQMSSNIFFVKDEKKKSKVNDSSKRAVTEGNDLREPKRKPVTKEELQKKANIKHSLHSTNVDWKYNNTEALPNKREKEHMPRSKSQYFRRFTLLNEDNHTDIKEKTNVLAKSRSRTNLVNLESVNYDIISGKKTDMSSISNPKKNDNVSDCFELTVNKNFDVTDVNTIKNYFINEGIHVYKWNEKSDNIGNKSGKIYLDIRRSPNDPEYKNKIELIKSYVKSKGLIMKETDYLKSRTEERGRIRRKTPGTELKKKAEVQKPQT